MVSKRADAPYRLSGLFTRGEIGHITLRSAEGLDSNLCCCALWRTGLAFMGSPECSQQRRRAAFDRLQWVENVRIIAGREVACGKPIKLGLGRAPAARREHRSGTPGV